MPLWDFNAFQIDDVMKQALQEEEAHARAKNGQIDQTDWWAINKRIFSDKYLSLGGIDLVLYLKHATIDIRAKVCF